LSRLFVSHSSKNDDWAIAIRDWLVENGWSGEDDIFLDLDPSRGIAAGERWAKAFSDAVTRCEAVLFLVSEAWVSSKWCNDEYGLAAEHHKKLFALKIDPVSDDRLPGSHNKQWQIITLKGNPAKRFLTVHPTTREQSSVYISEAALTSLRRGLDKAGIAPNTFDLHPDPHGPKGWRRPYRGLEALEPEDAAVFLGRDADIVRGLDTLRGLAQRKPPRMLVVLGASGAGKSSYLRAGLFPRLARDDAAWLALRPIRPARGGAIEGSEGLIAAIDEAARRCGAPVSQANIRQAIESDGHFIALINDLRAAAAKRALTETLPLIILSVDQAEEIFTADGGEQGARLLAVARAATTADAVLLLATIRSDSYGTMQSARELVGIHQETLSLGPVPLGEIAQIIRRPAEILRHKSVSDVAVWRDGMKSPVFDAPVVARLQEEVANEPDALPLLAYVVEQLMRDHATAETIGVKELDATGGVTAAIEAAAQTALADAKLPLDSGQRRQALRRLFIPRLARIDPITRTPHRRVAKENELPSDLRPLAHALVQRRLLVTRVASQTWPADIAEATTIEVTHEALLRKWPSLIELLGEDRDALLLLDGALTAANDWHAAPDALKPDFLMHRGSRLVDAQELTNRGPEWAKMVTEPVQRYLTACMVREKEQIYKERRIIGRAFVRPTVNALHNGFNDFALQLAAAGVLLANDLDVGVVVDLWNPLAQAIFENRTFAVLRGHSSRVTSASLSPDGRHIVTASDDHTARIWDAGTARQLACLEGHEACVMSALFSPDGHRVVTASADHTARIWDTAVGQQIALLEGHYSWVRSACFSPDGQRIVTASDDKTARIWDAATGQQITRLGGHTNFLSGATFSPDGQRILTASEDNTARLWNAASGQEIACLGGHTNKVLSAPFSPDGQWIVTASADNTARLWDAVSGQQIALLEHSDWVLGVAFSPDGKRIVTACADNTARVWETVTGQQTARLEGHSDWVRSAVFSPDGQRIVSSSDDNTTRIWDAASGQQIAELKGHTAPVNSTVFSSDGQRIVTSSDDKTARIWDAASGQQIVLWKGQGGALNSASFSPDGQRIVTSSDDKTGRIWDVASGQQIALLEGHGGSLNSASFSPDGHRIVTASDDKTARIWDAASGQEIARLDGHTASVNSTSFSPDGQRIVTSSDDNTARIWDTVSGQQIVLWQGHSGCVNSALFSLDGQRIVTSSDDKTGRIWDVASGQQIALLEGHGGSLNSASFSPDGHRIVTASDDKTARIWDAASGQEIAHLEGHTNRVRHASFSADGQRIVTSSADQTVRIWDAVTGRQIAQLYGHQHAVNSSSFNPDGQRIVTASDDNTAGVWDVSRTKCLVSPQSIVLTAALSHGIGWRTDRERTDVPMHDAEDDLYALALKQLGRTSDDPEIARVADQLRAPLHVNCYLSPTQIAKKIPTTRTGSSSNEPGAIESER
jgi:WD40 repeat protein